MDLVRSYYGKMGIQFEEKKITKRRGSADDPKNYVTLKGFIPQAHRATISVFVLDSAKSLSAPFGKADGIGSSMCYVALADAVNKRGTEKDSAIAGNAALVAHEMGHCLALFHTFGGSELVARPNPSSLSQSITSRCSSIDPSCPSTSNCEIAGDCLCDTPAESLGNADLIDCHCMNRASRSDNIMSYHSQSTFTDGQGGRMRRALANWGRKIHNESPVVVNADGDGLIEIQSLNDPYNIRYNLAGTSYKTSAGDAGSTNGCGSKLTGVQKASAMVMSWRQTWTFLIPLPKATTLIGILSYKKRKALLALVGLPSETTARTVTLPASQAPLRVMDTPFPIYM